ALERLHAGRERLELHADCLEGRVKIRQIAHGIDVTLDCTPVTLLSTGASVRASSAAAAPVWSGGTPVSGRCGLSFPPDRSRRPRDDAPRRRTDSRTPPGTAR